MLSKKSKQINFGSSITQYLQLKTKPSTHWKKAGGVEFPYEHHSDCLLSCDLMFKTMGEVRKLWLLFFSPAWCVCVLQMMLH